MEFNAVSEKVKNTKMKFIFFSITLLMVNVAIFKSVTNIKTWVWFVLISFVIWSIAAFVYEFAQRKNKQNDQEAFMNSVDAKTFFLHLNQKVKHHKKKAFFTFIALASITWVLYQLPISGILSFMFGLIALVWFIVRFGFNIFYIDFPTHLQLKHNVLSGKKDDRYLWSVDLTKQISYEANDIDGELIRTFYIREPKKVSSFSFSESELSQSSLFFELISKILECDLQLFYQSTYEIAIPLHELSLESIEKVKPAPLVKRSTISILLHSLWNMISFYSVKYDSLGHRNLEMRTRRGITYISLIMALVWGIQTTAFFKAFTITSYPTSQNFFVTEGTLSIIDLRKAPDYLVLELSNGRKIKLNDGINFSKLREQVQSDKPYVKVWWFPLQGSEMGWIAKLELNNQLFVSEVEQKEHFMREKENYFEGMLTTYLLLIPALLAWIWEFIVQYKVNKRIEVKENTERLVEEV